MMVMELITYNTGIHTVWKLVWYHTGSRCAAVVLVWYQHHHHSSTIVRLSIIVK